MVQAFRFMPKSVGAVVAFAALSVSVSMVYQYRCTS